MEAQLFDFSRLFFGDIATWHYYLETFVRIGFLFTCTILVFHFLYRKDIVEFTSADLIVMLVLGTIIGDTAFYHDVPLVHSFIALCLTVLAGRLITYLGKRNNSIDMLMNGATVLVILDGVIKDANLEQVGYSQKELLSLLRLQGILHTGQVAYGFIETNGQLSIIKSEQPSSQGISTVDGLLQ